MVSCISVFNLAIDATEREVSVLFSACPGYVRCIIAPGKQTPHAFVQFSSPEHASAAIEARRGTSWGEMLGHVRIEFAKRDIPAHFTSRAQPGSGAAPGHAGGGYPAIQQAPAPKRARGDFIAQSPPPPPPAPAGGGGMQLQIAGLGGGPCTLHVGGLPEGITQELLEEFLQTNFADSAVGGKLAKGGGKETGRAFIGFVSNQTASDAFHQLHEFKWPGTDAILKVGWARSEFRPKGAGAASTAPQYTAPASVPIHHAGVAQPMTPAPSASYASPYGGGGYGGGGGGGGGGAWSAPAAAPGGGVRRTLHYTGLPQVVDQDFRQFLEENFPGRVERCKFVDKQDGRPPVAWVLFIDDSSAAAAQSSLLEFHGSQLKVSWARRELDPEKVQ